MEKKFFVIQMTLEDSDDNDSLNGDQIGSIITCLDNCVIGEIIVGDLFGWQIDRTLMQCPPFWHQSN